MCRLFLQLFVLSLFVACRGDDDGFVQQQRGEKLAALWPNAENRMPSVDYFTPSFYNIELIELDSTHPVMQITYFSRRLSGSDYRWVDAVLRLDITPEQRAQLQNLLRYEGLP